MIKWTRSFCLQDLIDSHTNFTMHRPCPSSNMCPQSFINAPYLEGFKTLSASLLKFLFCFNVLVEGQGGYSY